MLKKTIMYEDPFEGGEVTGIYYFNLTRAEITEWEFSIKGGLRSHLEEVMQNPEENGKEIMAAIKDIILRSYGRREGSNFIKNDRIREEFESSEAYSQLFWELCTDAEKASEFMNSVVPKDLASLPNQEQLPVDRPNLTEVPKPEPRILTKAELAAMDHEELQSGLAEGRYILSKD